VRHVHLWQLNVERTMRITRFRVFQRVSQSSVATVRRWSPAALAAALLFVMLAVTVAAPSSLVAHEGHEHDVISADGWPIPDDTPLAVKFTWSGPVSFCIATSPLPNGVTAASFTSWVRQAMDAWNATDANVELRLSGPCTQTTARANGINEVAFEMFEQGNTAVGLAHTRLLNGNPIEGDVLLRMDWEATALCRINTLVHEFGHILGFSHSEYRSEVMGYGPCAVVLPTPAEVQLLRVAYGQRPAPLTFTTAAPDDAAPLTMAAVQIPTSQQQDAYYYDNYVQPGGNVLTLRAPECLTLAGRTDVECINQSMDVGYWYSDHNLTEVPATFGQTNIVSAAQLGHFGRQLAACNTVGCGVAFDARAGTVRASGTGVDFAYFAHARADGAISVQLINRSFYLPPSLLDVTSTFEVRARGVAGAAGLLGTCSLSLAQTCEVVVPAAQAVELILVSSGDRRTGTWFAGLQPRASAQQPPVSSEPVVSGPLPTQGVHIALWNGGPVSGALSEPKIVSLWIASQGVLRGYVPGAPSVVNSSFLGQFGSELAAGTPVILVIRP